MSFRKFSADQIFTGTEMLAGKVLMVKTDGQVEALIDASEAGEDIEHYDGILTPGFINCHCHLELSHMKGKIPEQTGLVDFVYKVVTERSTGEDEILQAIADAEQELMNGGVVAVGDICNNTSTLLQKQQGNLHYYNFIEASGWLPSLAQQRMARAKSIYQEFILQNNHCSIVPHAPYSVSADLWQELQIFLQGKVISIHNQETKFEDSFFSEGKGEFQKLFEKLQIDNSHHLATGKTSLQSYFPYMESAASVLLVHNTFTAEGDVDYLKQEVDEKKLNVNFCLCPNANLYIENALPPVEMLTGSGFNICLGTDSLASNHHLSILEEIKTLLKNFPVFSLTQVLQWATINGAKALQMETDMGSFEKGKTPGIVCIDAALQSAKRIV